MSSSHLTNYKTSSYSGNSQDLSDIFAPLESPVLTGNPQLQTTPTAGDNTTTIATTAFVQTAVAGGGGGGGGSGQGTNHSSSINTGSTPMVSNTIYHTNVPLTKGIWILYYTANLSISQGSTVPIQFLLWWSANSVSTFPQPESATQGQVSQVFSSIPQSTNFSNSSYVTISGTITLNPGSNTTYFANFQSTFTGGFSSLLNLNLYAIKIF
jgi:hypothetical protein